MAVPSLAIVCLLMLIVLAPLCVSAKPSEEGVEGTIEDYLQLHVNRDCGYSYSNITRVVRYRDSDVYNLNTTFVWDDTGIPGLSYEVGLARFNRVVPDTITYSGCYPAQCGTILLDDNFDRCRVVDQWYNTSTKEVTIPAPYSYPYLLYIHPWNPETGVFSPGHFFVDFPEDDCLQITNDREFCSTQDIELATAVVNLTGELFLTEDDQLLLNISWQEPIQLNPTNLCFFLVNIDGWAAKRVPRSGPRNPELVYSVQRNMSDLLPVSQTISVKVEVLGAHCQNNKVGLHSATIVVKYPSLEEPGSDPVNMTTVTVGIPGPETPPWSAFIFVAAVAAATMLVCIATLIVKWYFTRSPITTRFNVEDDTKAILPIFAEKELSDPSSVKYDAASPVGTGQYGDVYKGEVYLKASGEWKTAAIKVAKEHDLAWREDFLDEIKLLLELGSHPNIVEVLGCCTSSNPPLLITEFMRYGDLLHFLHKCRVADSIAEDTIYSISEADLVYIALQVAQGMKYISSSKFYHGDLSARNVLVGEGLVTKISDFGLANDLYETGYKRMAPGRKRPLRWVSLETLRTGYCSHQSDVWSYGVLLFEIFSLGATPYHDIPIHEISVLLQGGYRLPRPAVCPQEIYNTMRQCWKESPGSRPTFTELTEIFECLHQREDPSSTSACSFISNPDLMSVVFQPFFEEDDEPSLPVSTSLDTGSMLGSDSGVDSVSVRVTDAGSLADSESMGAYSSLGAYSRQVSTETGEIQLGVPNRGFDRLGAGGAVSDSDTLTRSGTERDGDEGCRSIHDPTNVWRIQRQDSGCHNDSGSEKDDEGVLSTWN